MSLKGRHDFILFCYYLDYSQWRIQFLIFIFKSRHDLVRSKFGTTEFTWNFSSNILENFRFKPNLIKLSTDKEKLFRFDSKGFQKITALSGVLLKYMNVTNWILLLLHSGSRQSGWPEAMSWRNVYTLSLLRDECYF